MEILTIISLSIMSIYLVGMSIRYGVKEYVSDNAYLGRCRWLFSAVMVLSSLTLLPAMLEKGGIAPFLALFAAFGLCIVGIEPLYKVEKMHATGAFIALICGALWVATFHPFIVACVAVAWVAYLMLKLPNPYYVGEVATFALIYANVLIE